MFLNPSLLKKGRDILIMAFFLQAMHQRHEVLTSLCKQPEISKQGRRATQCSKASLQAMLMQTEEQSITYKQPCAWRHKASLQAMLMQTEEQSITYKQPCAWRHTRLAFLHSIGLKQASLKQNSFKPTELKQYTSKQAALRQRTFKRSSKQKMLSPWLQQQQL